MAKKKRAAAAAAAAASSSTSPSATISERLARKNIATIKVLPVGTAIRRKFTTEWYEGVIIEAPTSSSGTPTKSTTTLPGKRYKVKYPDGEIEELSDNETQVARGAYHLKEYDSTPIKPKVGTLIRKRYLEGWYDGEVVSQSNRRLSHVKFTDGEEEDLTDDELKVCAYAAALFYGSDSESDKSDDKEETRPIKRQKATTPNKKEKKKATKTPVQPAPEKTTTTPSSSGSKARATSSAARLNSSGTKKKKKRPALEQPHESETETEDEDEDDPKHDTTAAVVRKKKQAAQKKQAATTTTTTTKAQNNNNNNNNNGRKSPPKQAKKPNNHHDDKLLVAAIGHRWSSRAKVAPDYFSPVKEQEQEEEKPADDDKEKKQPVTAAVDPNDEEDQEATETEDEEALANQSQKKKAAARKKLGSPTTEQSTPQQRDEKMTGHQGKKRKESVPSSASSSSTPTATNKQQAKKGKEKIPAAAAAAAGPAKSSAPTSKKKLANDFEKASEGQKEQGNGPSTTAAGLPGKSQLTTEDSSNKNPKSMKATTKGKPKKPNSKQPTSKRNKKSKADGVGDKEGSVVDVDDKVQQQQSTSDFFLAAAETQTKEAAVEEEEEEEEELHSARVQHAAAWAAWSGKASSRDTQVKEVVVTNQKEVVKASDHPKQMNTADEETTAEQSEIPKSDNVDERVLSIAKRAAVGNFKKGGSKSKKRDDAVESKKNKKPTKQDGLAEVEKKQGGKSIRDTEKETAIDLTPVYESSGSTQYFSGGEDREEEVTMTEQEAKAAYEQAEKAAKEAQERLAAAAKMLKRFQESKKGEGKVKSGPNVLVETASKADQVVRPIEDDQRKETVDPSTTRESSTTGEEMGSMAPAAGKMGVTPAAEIDQPSRKEDDASATIERRPPEQTNVLLEPKQDIPMEAMADIMGIAESKAPAALPVGSNAVDQKAKSGVVSFVSAVEEIMFSPLPTGSKVLAGASTDVASSTREMNECNLQGGTSAVPKAGASVAKGRCLFPSTDDKLPSSKAALPAQGARYGPAERIAIVESMVVESDTSWRENFSKVQRYYEQTGTCINLSPKAQKLEPSTTAICLWISTQRKKYHNFQLEQWKINALNSCEIDWKSNSKQFKDHYKKLLDFHGMHGHIRVPSSGTYASLYRWLSRQLNLYIKYQQSGKFACHMTREQVEMLEQVGVNDLIETGATTNGIQARRITANLQTQEAHLKAAEAQSVASPSTGDTTTSNTSQDSQVVECQAKLPRRRASKTPLEAAKTPLEVEFDELFPKLQIYYRNHGHLEFLSNDNKSRLGRFVTKQKKLNYQHYKEHGKVADYMTTERTRKLESLGIVLKEQSKEQKWMSTFGQVKTFYQTHFHFDYVKENARWEDAVRWTTWEKEVWAEFSKHQLGLPTNLSRKRIRLLDGIGFFMRRSEAHLWKRHFDEIKDFFGTFGHLHYFNSMGDNSGRDIARWSAWDFQQHTEYKKFLRKEPTSMIQGRVDLLESIHFFDWRERYRFKLGFEEVVAFFDKHGHLAFEKEKGYKEHDVRRWKDWTVRLRRDFEKLRNQPPEKTLLNPFRMQELDRIGFFLPLEDRRRRFEEKQKAGSQSKSIHTQALATSQNNSDGTVPSAGPKTMDKGPATGTARKEKLDGVVARSESNKASIVEQGVVASTSATVRQPALGEATTGDEHLAVKHERLTGGGTASLRQKEASTNRSECAATEEGPDHVNMEQPTGLTKPDFDRDVIFGEHRNWGESTKSAMGSYFRKLVHQEAESHSRGANIEVSVIERKIRERQGRFWNSYPESAGGGCMLNEKPGYRIKTAVKEIQLYFYAKTTLEEQWRSEGRRVSTTPAAKKQVANNSPDGIGPQLAADATVQPSKTEPKDKEKDVVTHQTDHDPKTSKDGSAVQECSFLSNDSDTLHKENLASDDARAREDTATDAGQGQQGIVNSDSKEEPIISDGANMSSSVDAAGMRARPASNPSPKSMTPFVRAIEVTQSPEEGDNKPVRAVPRVSATTEELQPKQSSESPLGWSFEKGSGIQCDGCLSEIHSSVTRLKHGSQQGKEDCANTTDATVQYQHYHFKPSCIANGKILGKLKQSHLEEFQTKEWSTSRMNKLKEALLFLTEKKDETIKGRMVLNDTDASNLTHKMRERNVWEKHYKQLEDYNNLYGNCYCPTTGHSRLGQWVGRQRRLRKRAELSQDRIDRLNVLGFDWENNEDVMAEEFRLKDELAAAQATLQEKRKLIPVNGKGPSPEPTQKRPRTRTHT